MRAYTIKNYGAPAEVLNLEDLEKPVPVGKEVLIRVRATSVNDYDWSITTGSPRAYRLFFGLFKPRKKLLIPGMEMAGIVEEIGPEATSFKRGDAVYGDISDAGFGSFAEFLCVDEKALSLKPEAMTFEEATSIPHAAMLALQGLRDVGRIQVGEKVLINGGGGGVGAFAIQFAKRYHTKVTGVDRAEKLEAMMAHGYDMAIDYMKEDFTSGDERYDLILDCRTNRSLWKYLKVLSPEGRYVSIGGKSGKLLQLLFMIPLLKLFSKKRLHMVALKTNKDLDHISELYQQGKIHCVIDGPYPFQELPAAVQRFGDALHHGKVVISVP